MAQSEDMEELIKNRNQLMGDMRDSGVFDKKPLTHQEIECRDRIAGYLGSLNRGYAVSAGLSRLEFLIRYVMQEVSDEKNTGKAIRLWIPFSSDMQATMTCLDVHHENKSDLMAAMEEFIDGGNLA